MTYSKHTIKTLCFLMLFGVTRLSGQNLLQVDGNGLFTSPSSTNVDIKNTDDNTNALVRFGDNDQSKVSLGFNGNDDVFKISTAATLGADDLTISLDGEIGVNTLPGSHRFLINHNSIAGSSAHLSLRENNTGDFARLRFENSTLDDLWVIAARATEGTALMNIFYNNGTDFANIMSFDGDLHRVGIHKTAPEAYLHIKQVSNSVPALLLQNDDQTGAEKWQILVNADSDLEFQFEGVTRGKFSSATGAYTPFPPPSALNSKSVYHEDVLEKILRLKPVVYQSAEDTQSTIGFDPQQVEEIDPDWVIRSSDVQHATINHRDFTILTIKALQEQQEYIDQQTREISDWQQREEEIHAKILQLESRISGLRN